MTTIPHATNGHNGARTTCVKPNPELIEEYLRATIPADSTGWLHTFIGIGGHRNQNGRYEFDQTERRAFRWPEEKTSLVTWLAHKANTSDAYIAPYLSDSQHQRRRAAAQPPAIAHADLDHGAADPERIAAAKAFAVASGSPGNAHAYIRLTRHVTLDEHTALCRALGDKLGGGDSKIAANDLLRPAGTINHKTTPPTPVTWLVPPTGVPSTDPDALLAQRRIPPTGNTNGAQTTANKTGQQQQRQQPINLADYPKIADFIREASTPGRDRSHDTMTLIGLCVDHGLTLDQSRWCAHQAPPIADRLNQRHDDDLATCWAKAQQSRQARAWSTPNGHTKQQQRSNADHISGRDDPTLGGQLRIAHRFAHEHEGTLIHVRDIGWHRYDGRRWTYAPEAATAAAKTTVRRALQEADEQAEPVTTPKGRATTQRPPLYDDAKKCLTATAITGVLQLAAADPRIHVTPNQLDNDPWLLNAAAGTLDLKTGQLRPHKPTDMITKIAEGSGHVDARSDLWDTFLTEVLPDAGARNYLQEVVGVALAGRVLEHIVLVLAGQGRNGKTVLINAVKNALGDYASAADPSLFLAAKNEQHPTGIADLRGRRLIDVAEIGEGRRLDGATLKRLSGGDKLKARYMRRDFFEFPPSHLAVLITNHLPKVAADDPAIWRRLRVIQFDRVFTDDEEDPKLPERLTEQPVADAILAWAIQGWLRYQNRGHRLETPQAVTDATTTYRSDNDLVGQFIDEACETGPTRKATTSALYEVWSRWQQAAGEASRISSRKFGQLLDAKGYQVDRTYDGRWRLGIAPNAQFSRYNGDHWTGSKD